MSSKKKKVAVVGQEAELGGKEVSTDISTPGGPGGALSTPRLPSKLLEKSFPEDVSSPYGRLYHTGNVRPMLDDEVQVYSDAWKWCLKGFHRSGTFSTFTSLPAGYDDAYALIKRWFTTQRLHVERELNTNLPITLTTLNDEENFENYCAGYHWMGAQMGILLNMDRLITYNEGLASVMTYLPKYISRVKKVWRRFMKVIAPNIVIAETWKDGQIGYTPGMMPVYLRGWVPFKPANGVTNVELPHGSAPISATDAVNMGAVLADDAVLAVLIQRLESMILAYEGLAYVANDKADYQAIQTLMTYLERLEPGYYGRMPKSENDFPGVVSTPEMLDNWRAGYLLSADTKGVSADEKAIFPSYGLAGFDSRIPVKGYGTPSEARYYSLQGKAKFGAIDVAGGAYGAYNAAVIHFGQAIPFVNELFDAASDTSESLYTREDGWVSLLGYAVDWGDGASIRGAINGSHRNTHHIWFDHVFKNQLTTTLEYRFVGKQPTPVQVWVDQDDFFDNYLTDMSKGLNIPKY